jgi:hypothetical protein
MKACVAVAVTLSCLVGHAHGFLPVSSMLRTPGSAQAISRQPGRLPSLISSVRRPQILGVRASGAGMSPCVFRSDLYLENPRLITRKIRRKAPLIFFSMFFFHTQQHGAHVYQHLTMMHLVSQMSQSTQRTSSSMPRKHTRPLSFSCTASATAQMAGRGCPRQLLYPGSSGFSPLRLHRG